MTTLLFGAMFLATLLTFLRYVSGQQAAVQPESLKVLKRSRRAPIANLDAACPDVCKCRMENARLVVDCRRRKLSEVPSFAGLRNETIYRIFLDGNRITDLHSKQFAGLNINGIQIADNPLMEIADDAFAGLESSLVFLSLRGTRLIDLPSAALAPLSNLEILDMSRVDPLMIIEENAFLGLTSLEELNLKGIRLIDVHDNAFTGLDSLDVLKMEDCGMTFFPKAINKLTSLRRIHLDQNKIDEMPDATFSLLPELEIITLSGNRLLDGDQYLPANAFMGLNKLYKLDLSLNEFRHVPRRAINGLKKLNTLMLNSNLLTQLHDESFTGLDSLKVLHLEGNEVVLTDEVLEDIRDTLEVLHIGRAGLTWANFPHDVLRNLTKLVELDLQGNEFRHIPADAFSGLTAKTISLMYCNIERAEPFAFRGLPNGPLKIKLNWNKITNVSFVHDPCSFSRIELFRNPVHCDCRFRSMAAYNHIEMVGACASPPEVGPIELNEYLISTQESCPSFLDDKESFPAKESLPAKDPKSRSARRSGPGPLSCDWYRYSDAGHDLPEHARFSSASTATLSCLALTIVSLLHTARHLVAL